MEQTQRTVDTLIELDEPEALLMTIRREAERKGGERWRALALVLGEAEAKLDQLLNAKPAGPDFTKPDEGGSVKGGDEIPAEGARDADDAA